MKKFLSILLVCLLATTLFAACDKANSNEIRIGINYELSGDCASVGFE
jgi:hypothetical protein